MVKPDIFEMPQNTDICKSSSINNVLAFYYLFSWYLTRFFSVSPSTMPHLRPFQIRSDSLWNGLLFLKNIEILSFVSASGLHFTSGLEWHHNSRLHFLCVSAEGHSVWKFQSSSFRTTVFFRSFTLRLISIQYAII